MSCQPFDTVTQAERFFNRITHGRHLSDTSWGQEPLLTRQAGTVERETVEGAEDGDGDTLGVKKFLGERVDFFARDSFDRGENVVERVKAVEIEFLAREVGHAGAAGFEREHERTLEMIFSAQELFRGDGRFLQGAEFLDGEIDDLADAFRRSAGVNSKHAGVGIGSDFAEDGVGKAEFLADILEKAGRHAAAKKIVEDGDAEAALVREGKRRDTDAEVDLLEVGFRLELNERLGGRSSVILTGTRGLESGKFALGKLENALVSDIAGSGQNDVVWGKPTAKAIAQGFTRKFLHRARGAENGAPERMIGPETAGEQFLKKIFGIVHVHLDFFEDNLALLPDVFGVKQRPKNEVGENIEGDGEMFVEDLGVKTDLLLGSEGVQHAADGIHFAGDGLGGAALGTLENHVLDEMSEAVFLRELAAGTVADPEADGD